MVVGYSWPGGCGCFCREECPEECAAFADSFDSYALGPWTGGPDWSTAGSGAHTIEEDTPGGNRFARMVGHFMTLSRDTWPWGLGCSWNSAASQIKFRVRGNASASLELNDNVLFSFADALVQDCSVTALTPDAWHDVEIYTSHYRSDQAHTGSSDPCPSPHGAPTTNNVDCTTRYVILVDGVIVYGAHGDLTIEDDGVTGSRTFFWRLRQAPGAPDDPQLDVDDSVMCLGYDIPDRTGGPVFGNCPIDWKDCPFWYGAPWPLGTLGGVPANMPSAMRVTGTGFTSVTPTCDQTLFNQAFIFNKRPDVEYPPGMDAGCLPQGQWDTFQRPYLSAVYEFQSPWPANCEDEFSYPWWYLLILDGSPSSLPVRVMCSLVLDGQSETRVDGTNIKCAPISGDVVEINANVTVEPL